MMRHLSLEELQQAQQRLRRATVMAIGGLIAMLDWLDGDPDLEPEPVEDSDDDEDLSPCPVTR